MALSDDEREELTAYLDGELDEEAARVVEARLNVDADLRAEANALRQAHDLLEYLPRTEASGSFTHRTLERLALGTISSSQSRPLSRPASWWPMVGWAAVLLLALGAGYGIASFIPWSRLSGTNPEVNQTDEQLVRYLKLLENRRFYENVPDLEFLKALDRPDLFGDN